MTRPLMPKATAVWLVDNTSLSFEQIAEFCEMHLLEISGIADGEVAIGVKGLDPVTAGQLTREEIARCEADPAARLHLRTSSHPEPAKRSKGARYTPVSRRQDRPDAIAWLLRHHPELQRNDPLQRIGHAVEPGLAQLVAEKANPKTDVWFGGTGDPHLQAAEEGLTEAYKSPRLAELQDWAVRQAEQSKYRTVGIYAGALGYSFNVPELAKRKLAEPKCWADLAKPEFKDDIQVANPNSSGTSYTMLATLVQLMGEQKAFDFMKAMHKNVNQYTKSGAAPARAAATGESLIGITFQHDAVTQAVNGAPVKIVSPCEGTGYEIGSMSIVKGAKNMDNAKKWYDWALAADDAVTMRRLAALDPTNTISSVKRLMGRTLAELKDAYEAARRDPEVGRSSARLGSREPASGRDEARRWASSASRVRALTDRIRASRSAKAV